MSTATDTARDRAIVTCPDCGRDRDVHRKTYNNIRNGRASARCQNCGNRARAHTAPPRDAFGDWRTQAACRGMDPERFFPHIPPGRQAETVSKLPAIAEVKAICAECPVRLICLDKHRTERWGIWGGLTPDERGIKRRI